DLLRGQYRNSHFSQKKCRNTSRHIVFIIIGKHHSCPSGWWEAIFFPGNRASRAFSLRVFLIRDGLLSVAGLCEAGLTEASSRRRNTQKQTAVIPAAAAPPVIIIPTIVPACPGAAVPRTGRELFGGSRRRILAIVPIACPGSEDLP